MGAKERAWYNSLTEDISGLDAIDRARKAVEAASDKQASDIVMLDIRGLCSFADYFVLCSGESDRQLEAIREGIEASLDKEGSPVLHREGDAASGWLLLDNGDLIVHIFSTQQRGFYRLDEVWAQAVPLVRIQ
jgi:ribosome-associated protein